MVMWIALVLAYILIALCIVWCIDSEKRIKNLEMRYAFMRQLAMKNEREKS